MAEQLALNRCPLPRSRPCWRWTSCASGCGSSTWAPTVSVQKLLASVNRIKPAPTPVEKLPEEVRTRVRRSSRSPALPRRQARALLVPVPVGDLRPAPTGSANVVRRHAHGDETAVQRRHPGAARPALGDMMGDSGRDPNPASNNPADAGVSAIPAGFTYVGQFVDHDITLDVSSTLDVADGREHDQQHAHARRSTWTRVYGRGPALDPFLYVFPHVGPSDRDQVPARHQPQHRARAARAARPGSPG